MGILSSVCPFKASHRYRDESHKEMHQWGYPEISHVLQATSHTVVISGSLFFRLHQQSSFDQYCQAQIWQLPPPPQPLAICSSAMEHAIQNSSVLKPKFRPYKSAFNWYNMFFVLTISLLKIFLDVDSAQGLYIGRDLGTETISVHMYTLEAFLSVLRKA